MPKYKVNGRTFNIPDNEVDLFEADFPEAQLHYQTNDGRKFTIYANERKDFLSDFPDATELGWGETIKEQAKQADPFQSEDNNLAQPMFGSMSYQDNIGKPEDYQYYPSPLNEEGRAETQPLSPEERSKQEYEMLMGHLKDFDNNNGDFMDTYEAYEKAAKHQINEGGFAIDTFERRYLDENSNEYHQRKMEKDELNARIKSNSYFNQMRMTEADAANETVDAISNLMAQNEAENSELHKKMQAMNALSMNPRGSFSGFAKTKEMQEYMDERADLETAKRLYENTAQVYAAPINDGEDILKKFGQGFGQRVDDADFWTMGIIGIADDMNARAAFQKIQDKLGSVKELANLTDAEIDALLTPSEQLLISAVMDNNAAQYARMDNTSGAYQAGAGAADSLMFMAQFLLTGGIGEAATVGTAAHRRLVSWLGRKVGSMSNGLMKDVARGAVKLGVGTAESIGKALVMTPLMPHTYANIADKMMSFDDNGELMDTTDAIISGSIDALIETWSESTGDFVNKILGVPGNITKGVAKKVLKNVDFSDWGKAMNAPMMKILKKGGFNGFLGEMGEEFIGNATRSLVGTLAPGSGQDPEALKNFAQWEQLLITAGSFAPMTIFGLGVSSAQYGWQKRQLNNAQKAFESMLREASYTEDQARFIVDELLGSTDANLTPEKLVANFSPLLKELAFNDRFANNRTQAMQSAVDFMLQIARYRTFDGVYHRQEEQQRNDMLAEIQEGTGREFWTTRLSENAGLDGTAYETDEVRAVEFNDGRVAYVLGSDGTTNTVVYNDGQTGFLSEEQLNEGKANGSIVSDATMGLNDYLTQQVARVRMTEEEQRMFDERNTNIGQVRAQFPIDATVELGTTEAPIQGVVRQQTPDGVIVESPAGISQLTWEELGHTMGLEVNPQTDSQMEEEAINNLEIADLQRRRAREQRRTQRNTAAEAALAEEQMLDEAENEGLEKPIPMKADGTVDQTAFWNESPARWAQWKTEQRQDGGAYASSYIQNAIGILEGQIAESEAAFLVESDFDAKDALEQTINQQRARLAELQDLSMQYMPSVIPAETSVEATAEQTQPSEETAQPAAVMAERQKFELDAEYQRRLSLAKTLAEKEMILKEYFEAISAGSMEAVVMNKQNYKQIMKDNGCDENAIERVTRSIKIAEEVGQAVSALHANDKIFVIADYNYTVEQGRVSYVHERQHNITKRNPELIQRVLSLGLSRETLQKIVRTLSGTTFYDNESDEVLADEILSSTMEIAYTFDDFSVTLSKLGLPIELINVLNEINDEQRNDFTLANARRNAIQYDNPQGNSGQNVRDQGEVSGGILGEEGDGSLGDSNRRTESGEPTTGGAEASEEGLQVPVAEVDEESEEVNPAFVEAISTDVDEAEYAQFLDDKAFADPQPVDGIQPDDVRFSIVLEDKMRGNTQAYFDKHYNGGTLGKKDQKLVPLNVTHFTQVLLDAANAQIEEMRRYMLPYLDMESKGKRFLPAEVYGKSTLFDNSSYGKTMENTLICTRTLAYIDFVEEVKKRIGRPLTATESFLASQMLYDIAIDPQCLYCYVSLDRKAYDEFLLRYIQQRDEVISKWNASDKSAEAKDALYKEFLAGRKPTSQMQARFESWLLLSEGDNAITPADLATKARRGDLKISEAPEAWEKARNKYQKLKGDKKLAYAASEEYQTALWNYLASPLGQVTDAEAYAQSASWAKKEEDYRSYTGELLKCTADALKGLMGHYGLRFYSFSEYSPAFILENMQMVRDAAARGLKGFAYTKEIDFIKIFAPTGMNINCSVYGRVDSEGNVVPDIKQGADWAQVQALREQYPNVGAVFVATNDEMVEWALNQPWIDVIIPFHIVRTGADIAKFYEWTNYSSMQADTAPSGKTTYIFPHEHHNDKTTFLKIAQERGLSPRFADVKLADGRSIVEHPNYMRLVNETRRSVDETPILTPTFNVDAAKESFDAFVAKGGYYSGYFYEDEAFEQGIETVVEDIKAGKTAKDVDYGRQDVPIDVAKIMAKRAEMERKHGKSGVIDLVEEAKKAVDNTSDIRFSIIGEMGATRDRSDEGLVRLNNLEVARQMESQLNPDWSAKNDENALKIKVATGWERGADGKWRYEVDDVTIKPAKDWLLSKKKLTLRDIVEPNPVFDIYPELLDIAVVKDKSKYNLGAWYAESTKQMKLPVGALKDDYTAMMDYYGEEQKDGNFARYWKIMEEDFLHEIQHAIQHREGFARGGNPDMLLPEDMEAYNKLYDEMSDLIDTYNSIPTRDRNMAYAISARNQAQRAKDGVTSFLRKHKLGEERYKRLAGEVESNNVVKRSKLSDYERYNSLLASTEDVARKDQIFLMNAVESAESSLRFRITPEMKEIKKQAEKDGTFMKAPNGADTNLTPEQWAMVRTKAFKAWFGDWINDPENASKVVDENGEPKVVYHQTNQKIYVNRETGENWDELGWKEKMEWDERDDWEDYWEEQDFNTFSRVNARTTNEFDGFFFAPEYDENHEYGDRTIAAFVNIKNPASREDYNIDSRYNDAGRNERIRLQEAGFDGVIRMDGDNVDEYIAFEPNQIKSATDNNGDFNPNNNDIRFRVTAEQDKAYMDAVKAGDLETAQKMVDAAARAAGYDSPKLYHGTRNFGFTKADVTKSDDGISFFATTSPSIAKTYSSVGGERRISDKASTEDRKAIANELGEAADDYLLEHTSNLAEWLNVKDVDAFALELTDMVYGTVQLAEEQNKDEVTLMSDLMTGYDAIIDKYYDADKYASSEEQINNDDGTWDNRMEVIAAYGKYIQAYNNPRIYGNYTFYATTWAMEEIDCKGANWNNIKSSDLPQSSRPWTTRRVARFMKEEGWKGVILKNIVDLGGRANIPEVEWKSNIYIFFEPQWQVKSADPVTYDDNGNVIPLSERFNPENADIRFRMSNENQAIFVSNAAKAVEGIKQEKATPEQWLKMIEKAGGLKAGEDKWMGLSDWLKASDKKTLTKQEVLDFINENMIVIEEQHYSNKGVREEADRILNENYPGWEDAFSFDWDPFMEDPHSDIYDEVKAARLYNETHEDQVETDEDGDIVNDADYNKVEEFGAELAGIWYGRGKENTVREIHGTREEYTTNGLTNLHEIALTVPTIEPWNESDDIHFGDAGEGRAVAWIRFGEAEVNVQDETQQRLNEIYDRLDELEMKVSSTGITEEEYNERARLRIERDELQEIKPKTQRVLVIDEIQSKRHQEGREKGYKKEEGSDIEIIDDGVVIEARYNGRSYFFSRGTSRATIESSIGYDTSLANRDGIPDAPFDKNWHELAMKRMLRYAAENGYDVIAWTKGDQQAERYNIGDVVTSVDYRLNNDGSYRVDTMGRDGYQMEGIPTTFNSEAELAEIFGKDIARKIAGNLENDKQAIAEADKEIDELREWFSKNTKTDEADLDSLFESAINNPEQSKRWNELEVKKEEARKGHTLSETDFRIGGEGMKGFYDKILPAFMNKYGKKWGVNVEDIHLNLEGGIDMHSVPVTEEMKASVMEGQVMFRMRGENESAKEFTDSIVKDFKDDYNAAAPIEIVDLNSKEDVARFFNIPAEDITDDDIQFIKNDVEKKDIWAAYHPDLKKIVIFVRDSLTDSKKGELALIHENIHAINGKYPEFLALGEYLWNRVEEGTKEHKYKTAIQKFYPEHKWHDELSAYVVSEHMQNGTLDELRYILDLEHTNILNKILNTSGYGKERKSDRAGFFRNVLRKRSSGKVGRTSEKKGGASELTAEERRIIGEYFPEFNKSEDVRMRVNSQGKELTEGQEEFFANSKAVDKDGNLLVLYHGTPRAGFTEFKSGWFTTSKEDAISYSGDRKGRLFDPDEKYEPETLTAGDFRLGYMTFDSEEDRAAFLERFPYADDVMSEKEYEDARMGAEDEEYDALTARRKEFAEVWNAYREYERERFVDTTIGDLIANPEAYTEEDLMRAMLEYDSNASFDNLDDMSAEERKDALVSALQNANEETEGGILDMVIPTRVPRNGEGLKHNDLGNRTYEVYANVENPYEIDAKGRGSEFESGDIYKSVEEALADEQYDGIIIRNWRVGRTQQLGDVVVPKNGSQIKLTSNENPTESSDIQFRITEEGEDPDIRFSIRTKPAPEHVETAYKLFNVDENGNPHALFIDGANALERGVWYDADSPLVKDLEKLEPGFTYLVDKDGNAIQKQYKNKQKSPSKAEVEEATANGSRYILVGQYANGKKSYHNWGINGSGQVSKFAMRPGWHLTDSPSARHIGEERNPEKKEEAMYRRPNQRWFKVEYAADVDYNEEAASNPTKDIQTHIPEDGYYSFKTNTNANDVNQNWIISGSIRILDPLSREEVTRLNSENGVPDDLDYREEPSFRTTGTPTDEVVANGLHLTPAQTAEVAANIFAALPEESRKKITEGLNGNILGLKDAILQIPTSLATKENWNEVDRAMADVVAEEMTKMAGEMTRPFSAEEGLWLLYNNLNKGTDLISQASRALVQRNLGFDAETLAKQEQAKEDVRFRTVGDASSNAEASLYNRGAANVWTRLKESYVDMMASVEELVKAIEKRTGKVAQGFENILLALNQQSSKGLAAMESYTQRFLNPMFDEIRRIMDETKMKYEDVVRYVILKHGLERNKKLAQRDARAHYQEIYDDIISKINSMDDRQKRTYLTNAQLKEADAKANLSTLQAVDTSLMTDEEKKEHKKQLAIARKAVAEAEEYLKRAEKIRSMSEQEAKDELDKIFEKIENGTDSVFKEMRENDYSGISSMFYDQLGVDRKKFSTEEQYQAALMEAKKDRYSSLKDIEAAAEAEVKSFEGKTDTKELWKRINAATKETLRQQYEANMISKDQYLNLRDMFEYYVPLRGFKDNTAEDMYTYYRKPNSTGYTKPILGAEGRKTEAESPFGWIAAMAGSAIASNVKNEAKLALYYFVSNRPENGIATISKTWFVDSGEVDERGKKIFKPAYPPFSEDLSSAEGKAQYEIWQANMKELQKKGQAYEAGQRLNLGNAVVNISDANKPEHIVNVKVGGKDYTIIINGNPRAAQAINGDLNIEGTAQDYSALFGPVLRWMSSVNTSYNPEFWITNMMRDMAFTWMAVNIKEDPAYRRKFSKNYRKAFKVISLVAKNEKGTIGDSYLEQQYKDFVKYGGVTGYTQIKDSETWEKEIDNYLSSNDPKSVKNGKVMRGMKSAFHAAHRFGESLEQVSRFAAFLTAKETGKSINEAINDAKEITVNFNRKGSGKMITLEEAKYLTGKNGQPLTKPQQWMVVGLSSIAPLGRRFIMFFNAAIQGLNATYKLMKKNPKRFTGWALGYAAVGMMNAVLHAMLDDDDDYLDIPQYERRNSLMIGGNGAYFKWALPQEARAFYALGDLAVETVMGRNPHQNVLGEALKIGTEILPVNPSEGWKAFMPSVAIPFIELALNEDYKGAPVYNDQKWLSKEEKERTAKWSNAYQGTGWTYVKIAQGLNFITGGDKHDAGWINLQPEKLEHLVQSAFGGTIRTADKFINTISAAIDPEEPNTVRQAPFLNRFLTINDERFKNVHVNDVFDYYKADAEHALTLEKQYTKDRDKESLTELRSSDEYQWAKIYGKYKKPLKSIQDKIKVADGTAEKKELMKQQDELKKRMIKEISEL